MIQKINKLIEETSRSGFDISPGMELSNHLELDSLDVIELIIKIEQEFSVSIPDQEIDKLITVQDVYNVTDRYNFN